MSTSAPDEVEVILALVESCRAVESWTDACEVPTLDLYNEPPIVELRSSAPERAPRHPSHG